MAGELQLLFGFPNDSMRDWPNCIGELKPMGPDALAPPIVLARLSDAAGSGSSASSSRALLPRCLLKSSRSAPSRCFTLEGRCMGAGR